MKNTELLIYMLEDIRKITLLGISGLTKEQLFAEPVPGEYCIGAYLMHLAECDLWWLHVMDGLEQDPELAKRAYSNVWFDAGDDSNPPKEAPEVNEYIEIMTKCRAKVINYINSISDDDLEKKVYMRWVSNGEEKSKEFTPKWIIYHLIEHEAHTRGQIFMLIRMAGFKKKGENN
jgi:uncharacterized damage-inducible protein DinB